MIPQGLDLPLLLFRKLQQAEPLGNPVRSDSVLLQELQPVEFVPEHLRLEFTGEDEWVTVVTSAGFGDARTWKSQRKDLASSGLGDEWFGVPPSPFEPEAEKGSLSTPLVSSMVVLPYQHNPC